MAAAQTLLLELNEISFEYVQKYCNSGLLPNLSALIDQHGLLETEAEREYDHLEPWIQWVTAHTGLSLAEHGIFRLGDIVQHDIPQIWELLESQGLRVGAVSPMNAKCRVKRPSFFVPDPWTETDVLGPPVLEKLYQAIAQGVNDNAQSKVTVSSLMSLTAGVMHYASLGNLAKYMRQAISSLRRPWRRALFVDRLLADVFIEEVKRNKPHFASLFLNAGAHIQHHYLFSSKFYDGALRNPKWYLGEGLDPVQEAYEAYDDIVGLVRRALPSARLVLATGLSQIAHPDLTYYWRLKKHAWFVKSLGITFSECVPRMSRDFELRFANEEQSLRAAARLAEVKTVDGQALFAIDNRGTSLFVTFAYSQNIDANFVYTIAGRPRRGLRKQVAFVALKNGRHHTVGYLVDTGMRRDRTQSTRCAIPLVELPRLIANSLGVSLDHGEPRTRSDALEL